MLTFLRRHFISDYQNVQDEMVRAQHGVLAAWLGFAINLILVALKVGFAFALASASSWIFPMALLADAVDSAGDMLSNLVVIIGFKEAAKPADAEHPYGHERMEYISGIIVAMLVIFAGIELIITSIKGIVGGSSSVYQPYIFIVLGVSILLKALQGWANLSFARIISSSALKATAIDSFTDILATFAVVLSAIFDICLGWGFLDGYFGIAVSLFILYSGFEMIKETADPLIGKSISQDEYQEISETVLSHKEILGVHDIRIHRYGPTKTFISLHAELNESSSFHDVHELIDCIEDELKTKKKAEVTIHMDPIDLKDKETLSKKALVRKLLLEAMPEASLHDFHIHKGQEKDTIEFDVILPYARKKEEAALLQKFQDAFPSSILSITFDYPYSQA